MKWILLLAMAVWLDSGTDVIEVKASSDKAVLKSHYAHCNSFVAPKGVLLVFTIIPADRKRIGDNSVLYYTVRCPGDIKTDILLNKLYTLKIKYDDEDSTYFVHSIKELE